MAMFSKSGYHCPRCGFEIREELADGGVFACSICGSSYKVLLDAETGEAGFIEQAAREVPEPLYLPRGSIRALVAMAVAVSCWLLIFTQRDVPGSLFSLVLTILGYYFGFRAKVKAAGSRILDPSATTTEPLFLPPGFIRGFLILGFLAAGAFLFARGRWRELKYLEFIVVLFGLIAGYLFGRIMARGGASPFSLLVNHVKGAAVLAVAAYLTYLFVLGGYAALPPVAVTVLCAFVSFYFGSRT